MLSLQERVALRARTGLRPRAWARGARLGRLLASRQLGDLALALVLPAGGLALWALAARNEWLSPQILPPPALVWATFEDLLRDGEILGDLAVSLGRVLEGFALGAVAGLALGVAMGLSRRVEAYVSPLFRAVAQVPSLGWLPVLMLLVGIGDALKLLIIAKACMVPITLSTLAGIRDVPQRYFEVAQVFRLGRRDLVCRLVLPAALPPIFSGVRLALSHAWIALVVVEIVAGADGIGYMMAWGRTLFQLDVVIAGMVVVGLVGWGMDLLLRLAERRLSRWRLPA